MIISNNKLRIYILKLLITTNSRMIIHSLVKNVFDVDR